MECRFLLAGAGEERQRAELDLLALALDVELGLGARLAFAERHVGRADVRVERGRRRARAHPPELRVAADDLVALARHARAGAPDADEPALRALRDALERRAADPVALLGLERDAEREAGLDRVVRRVDLMAVE